MKNCGDIIKSFRDLDPMCVCLGVCRGGGGKLPNKKDGESPRTFLGLKTWFWSLLGCLASKGPQREFL